MNNYKPPFNYNPINNRDMDITDPRWQTARIKHILLQKVRQEVSTIIPLETFTVQGEEAAGRMAGSYIVNVLMKFFGHDKKHINTETNSIVTDLYVPATWWDHFKHDYFPIWLQIYFPIKYNRFDHSVHTTTKVYETKICPHLINDRDNLHIEWLVTD